MPLSDNGYPCDRRSAVIERFNGVIRRNRTLIAANCARVELTRQQIALRKQHIQQIKQAIQIGLAQPYAQYLRDMAREYLSEAEFCYAEIASFGDDEADQHDKAALAAQILELQHRALQLQREADALINPAQSSLMPARLAPVQQHDPASP
jgi:hypothetical protein